MLTLLRKARVCVREIAKLKSGSCGRDLATFLGEDLSLDLPDTAPALLPLALVLLAAILIAHEFVAAEDSSTSSR